MANFKQHLSFGFIGTGILIAPLLSANYITTSEATLVWLCGSIGAIIPDIDSDNAIALDILFLGIALYITYSLLENFGFNRSGLEIVLMVIGAYGATTLIRLLFEKLSVHRGVFHSILASVFFGLATCVITWHINQISPFTAWLSGAFMTFGVLLHLLLDEIYSVDFMNVQMKKSFGSALKITSFRNLKASVLLLIGCVGLWYIAPTSAPFVRVFYQTGTYSQLWNHFIPKGWW